jgi:hypothetical protein
MFRLRYLSIIAAAALCLTVGSVAITRAGSNTNQSAIQLDDDSHPNIHKALNALTHARNALQDAAHDYDGHRAQALKSVDDAIAQCNICLTLDK